MQKKKPHTKQHKDVMLGKNEKISLSLKNLEFTTKYLQYPETRLLVNPNHKNLLEFQGEF